MDFDDLIFLVVEDDPDARELMQVVLQQRGASVVAAESVRQAFELLEGALPDVIISDIAMPEEDGLTLVRRLRAMPPDRGGRIPTNAVSAYAGTSDRLRALTAGFDRYLHKPVNFEELLSAIVSVLRPVEGKATA